MDYKYQLVAISVVFILLVVFLKNRKLPLLSTKVFFAFLITSLINLIAEVFTIYGLKNYWMISPVLLRLYHQIFIGSLDLLIFSLYLYASFLENHQKRFSTKQLIPRILPLCISLIMVVFAPLHYHIAYGVKYSYGPMANTVYVSILIYVILTLHLVNSKNGTLAPDIRRSINIGIAVWVAIAVYQFFYPKALISSVGNMLIVFFIFLTFENPKEYQDIETDTLNRRAFHLVTGELMEGKKTFFLFNIVLRDMENIQNVLGHSEVYTVLRQITAVVADRTKESIYHSRSDTLSLMFFHKEEADRLAEWLSEYCLEYQAKDITINPKLGIHILECPRYAKTANDIYQTLDYIRTRYQEEESPSLYVDYTLIEKKNYYDAVEKLVEDAVANHGFEVYFQPIYDVEKKNFSSAEALVRLKDYQKLGFVSPEIFVPIAEEKGLIKELGQEVFEQVCAFARKKSLQKMGIHYIEVNLSAVQGTDNNIVQQLRECMERNQIPPEFINLEITETAKTTGGDKLKNTMDQLIKLGCHFSMDDFGTGYSNLAKMTEGEFTIIKLDKSLLWPCFEKEGEPFKAEVILNNCINMILQLGMKIVVEGVETKEQVDFLCAKGVNYLQGYYFSKPIPGEEYYQFLLKNHKGTE